MKRKKKEPPAQTKKEINRMKCSEPIPNEALTLEIIPGPDASWQEIQQFALSFNGYKIVGFKKCAEIANQRRHDSLDHIRACLFFEQRCFRWTSGGFAIYYKNGNLKYKVEDKKEPEKEIMDYVRSLVEKIREYVISGKNR